MTSSTCSAPPRPPDSPDGPAADCLVSAVVPLRDDGEIVESFVTELAGVLAARYAAYEIVLVDDASNDDTVARVTELLATRPCLRLIRLSRRFGQEIAISAGLDAAIGDFVVVMLPDTDPPRLVPEMVERVRAGAGIVFGVRRHRRGEPWVMRAGAALFFGYCNRVLRLNIPRNATHFRVMSRQAVNAVTQVRDRSRYLRTLSAYVGYAAQSMEYEPLQRRRVPRRKSLIEALRLALGIIVANSTHPLRAVSLLGLGASLLNALYAGYVVAIYLFKEHVAEGWVTQSLQSAVMFFLLFLILTVLAEYVGRLLDEVKDRPLYHVADEKASTALIADAQRRNVVGSSQ